MKTLPALSVLSVLLLITLAARANPRPGKTVSFNKDWSFHLGDVPDGQKPDLDDSQWRRLNLPHDWSIEGEFSEKNPASPGGGALPGGIGWYRKSFSIPASDQNKSVFVEFDGIYRNSEVWINGRYLGKRPYGYSSFHYELTPHLNYGHNNVIAVKVDNSQQPNSRWYSGSGIYRNVWLTVTDKVHVDHWGTCVTTPEVSQQSARINIKTRLRNDFASDQSITLTTILLDAGNKEAARAVSKVNLRAGSAFEADQDLAIKQPGLW